MNDARHATAVPPEFEAFASTRHSRLRAVLGDVERRRPDAVVQLVAHPDGRTVWGAAGDSQFRWDVRNGAELARSNLRAADAQLFLAHDEGVLAATPSGLYRWTGTSWELWSAAVRGRAVSISRDGASICARSDSGTRLFRGGPSGWSAEGRALGHGDAWPSHDGRLVLYAPVNNTRLDALDPARGARRWSLELGDRVVGCVLGPPGHAFVALRGGEFARSELARIDLGTGTVVWRVACRRADPTCIAASRSGSIVAVADDDGVDVFDAAGTRLREVVPDGLGVVRALAVAPGGGWLAYGRDAEVRVVELPHGAERALDLGLGTPLATLAWLRDSRRLVAAAEDEPLVRVWDTAAAACEWTFEVAAPAHTLRVLPRADCVVAGLRGRVASVCELFSDVERWRVPRAGVYVWATSPDGEAIYGLSNPTYGRDDHELWAFGFGDAEPRWSRRGVVENFSGSVAVTHDGDRLWLCHENRACCIDARDGTERSQRRLDALDALGAFAVLRDGRTLIGLLAREVAEMSLQHLLRRWNALTGEVAWERESALGLRRPLIISRGERWAVDDSSGRDRVALLDLTTGRVIDEIPVGVRGGASHCDYAHTVALSPDERRLAVGTARGLVLIFDLLDLEG